MSLELKFLNKNYFSSIKKCHNYLAELLGELSFRNLEIVDKKLNEFVGVFIRSIYSSNKDYIHRVCIDMRNHTCICYNSKNKHINRSKYSNRSLSVQRDPANDINNVLFHDLFL